MLVAILSSIKLYFNISTNITNELEISKTFHLLSLDIQKTLALPIELRKIEQLDFLNKCYDSFIILIQKSSLVKAEEETERMNTILQKIKDSPRIKNLPTKNPMLTPLDIPENNTITFGA
jgi:hypothetical protein